MHLCDGSERLLAPLEDFCGELAQPGRSVRRRNSSSVLAFGCSASLESRLIREILQAVGDGGGGGSQEWDGFSCVCVCVSELMSQNFSLCGKHTYISCSQMQHQPRYPCIPGSWDLVPGTVQASGNLAAGLTSRLLSFFEYSRAQFKPSFLSSPFSQGSPAW